MVMQFLENKKPLKLDEIEARFGYISDIYKQNLELDIDFEIDDIRIMLTSPYSNSVFTNVESVLDYHTKFFFKNSIYKEPLAKALGLKKGEAKPVVLDATAGMLVDSLLIHSFGCKVIAFERNPIAAILGLNTLKMSNINIDFYYESAINFEGCVDVIYFDPMYGEEKNSKTLPKKEMRIFRKVVGNDKDADTIAKKLKTKSRRLVIKRSVKASPILENPSMQITGKSTRYDVYLNT
jgi:16S rRNA (guanine1516-N2)-methyltransferase